VNNLLPQEVAIRAGRIAKHLERALNNQSDNASYARKRKTAKVENLPQVDGRGNRSIQRFLLRTETGNTNSG
jgi:hypothetical protein